MNTVRNIERDKLENVRYPEPRKPVGKTHLTEDQKLSILQQKQLQLLTQTEIAKQFDVARKTVNQLTPDRLKPETRAQLQTFVEGLAQARDKVIKRINEKLDKDTFKDGVYPNLLNAINNNYRLETDQSTANIAVKSISTPLQNWIQKTQPSAEIIEQKVTQIAEQNGINAQELLSAVMGNLPQE